MTRIMRAILILIVMTLAVVFIYPSLRWYFFTDSELKDLSNGTRNNIREWSQGKARGNALEIQELSRNAGALTKDIPGEYSVLIPIARRNYKLGKRDLPESWTLEAVLKSFKSQKDLQLALENHYSQQVLGLKDVKNRILALGLDISGGLSVVLEPDFASLEEESTELVSAEKKAEYMDSALELIRNRIDTFGVTEPQIRRQADDSIMIDIPGEADVERINSFLMGKGALGFHIVNDQATQSLRDYMDSGGKIVDGQPEQAGIIGEGFKALGYYTRDDYGIDQFNSWLAVSAEPGLDGIHLRDASPQTDPVTLQPVVTFRLDAEGGTIFQQLTSGNVGKFMTVVLDDKIKAYARINQTISGGDVQVTGFEYEEANDLAKVLRTGSLPLRMQIQSLQSVGASLGEDTIRAGLSAMLIGLALVLVFMAVWYHGAGIIAGSALLLNLVLLSSVLSSFNFTLTMTSIAGLILTVGMSVDANVIIFERIREELRNGKSRSAAIDTGFRKAFWTVMDAQITTFIAALFLSQLGKGPVKGFAVTLAWGIGCSLFTALFVSRLMFDVGTETLKRQRLSIGWGIK